MVSWVLPEYARSADMVSQMGFEWANHVESEDVRYFGGRSHWASFGVGISRWLRAILDDAWKIKGDSK